jgi:hypothetical protein
MGKLTISMAIFNSYVSLPEGIQLFNKNMFCCFGQAVCAGWNQEQ